MARNFLSSVSIAPLCTRLGYVQVMEDDPEDRFDVLCVGSPFRYSIPRLDVLAVELRQMKPLHSRWSGKLLQFV